MFSWWNFNIPSNFTQLLLRFIDRRLSSRFYWNCVMNNELYVRPQTAPTPRLGLASNLPNCMLMKSAEKSNEWDNPEVTKVIKIEFGNFAIKTAPKDQAYLEWRPIVFGSPSSTCWGSQEHSKHFLCHRPRIASHLLLPHHHFSRCTCIPKLELLSAFAAGRIVQKWKWNQVKCGEENNNREMNTAFIN